MNHFIILCTYNPNMGFFEQQIHSIISQSIENWSCGVFDDNSSLEKQAQIKEILAQDKRFKFYSYSERLGPFHNFERGLKCIPDDVDIILYADQDDVWEKNKLEEFEVPFKNKEVVLAHSDLSLIDQNDQFLHSSCFQYEKRNVQKYTLQDLLIRNSITGCACAFRQSLVPYLLPFPSQPVQPFFLHDVWTALIATQLGRIVVINKPLTRYRQHESNVIGASNYTGKWQKICAQYCHYGFSYIRDSSVKIWLARRSLIKSLLNHMSNLGMLTPLEERRLKSWLSPGIFNAYIMKFFLVRLLKRDISALYVLRMTFGKYFE